MLMLYPEFLVSNMEEVIPNQLQSPPQQTPLVILPTVEEIRTLQLGDTIVGKLVRAKETNQKPSDAYTKSQVIQYHSLNQQWDQLVVCDGVLWRPHFAHPNQDQSWLQPACGATADPSIYSRVTPPGGS